MKIVAMIFQMLFVQEPIQWEDNIKNPDNEPYVIEVAFNLDIEPDSVTQEQFNERYLYE